MKTASWVLLLVAGVLTLLASLGSVYIAHGTARDELGPGGPTLEDVAAGRPEIATALRGRRGTAAAFAASYAVLFLFVVLGPYRRGETWCWWALLTAALVLTLLTAARVPFLGTRLGAATGLIHFGVVLVALLLDVRRLRR
jgi:hypothetical protein